MKKIAMLVCLGGILFRAQAQDTFSIVAVDTVTGEVGSAGASCVDLVNFPQYQTDFLGELLPGLGAINSQSFYDPANQLGARTRMLAGDTPQQIINWLVANDVTGTPGTRQYGIAALVNGKPQTAAYTGVDCFDYKAHITGRNYAIQGNILSGQHVLDSMEARFLRAQGDLACKLMAALQGANSVGADTRCSPYGTSSLFAFVKVSSPADSFSKPSFRLTVKARIAVPFEPIDSLQKIFNATRLCPGTILSSTEAIPEQVSLYPNPATHQVYISLKGNTHNPCTVKVFSLSGKLLHSYQQSASHSLILDDFEPGMYIIEVENQGKIYRQRLLRSME
jgi:uncharacterized Ntn-hydrolase superfamily protein